MATVTYRSVSKRFGSTSVLEDIDIDIADGEFVVFVGPSGCGKSTLLRMLAGLEPLSGGEILIDGVIVSNLPPRERDIAMVFQNYALYPHLTVEQNIGFPLRMQKFPRTGIEQRVAEAANMLGLEALLKRYPRELSGGQRQRVAMGRALVRNPAVFLFDEPLSNLDAALRVQMRSEIRRLHKRLGATTIYVTHDQVEAMTMADRIVVLKDGRVEQIGAPLDLYRKPANAFVGQFIGSPSMNLMDATVRDGGQIALIGANSELTIAVEGVHGRTGSVCAGIRPEHIQVVSAARPGAFPVTVIGVENLGQDQILEVDLEGLRVHISQPATTQIDEGDKLLITLAPAAIHIFDGR